MNAPVDFTPHAIDAEQQLLGVVMLHNDIWFTISDDLEADHFFEGFHRDLWRLICDRMSRNEACGPVHLIAAMGQDATINFVGTGMSVEQYIRRLYAEVATVGSAPGLARTIRDMWQRRRIIVAARELQAKALTLEGANSNALLDEVDVELSSIRYGRQVAGVQSLSELLDKSLKQTADAFELKGNVGFSTGIGVIDRAIGPIMPGDVVTVLAPSGHGKSALGAQILRHNAEYSLDTVSGNVPGIFFSMEMDALQNARRLLTSESGAVGKPIRTQDQKSGRLNQADYERLLDTRDRLQKLPIYIDASGRQKASSIVKKARAMQKAYGTRIAVIDHAKLFLREHSRADRFEIGPEAAMMLKDAAKNLDMAFILLAQVTSESQKRPHWRIKAADLWGGESIKECSDIFLTITIPWKWLQDNPPERDADKGKWDADCGQWYEKAEFAAPKVRDGETCGFTACKWDGKRMMFGDL